ncbi:MAG: FecR domain-containing protein [Archangium sp.]|nr:FecR domain-containing protein [Archangium sp.]
MMPDWSALRDTLAPGAPATSRLRQRARALDSRLPPRRRWVLVLATAAALVAIGLVSSRREERTGSPPTVLSTTPHQFTDGSEVVLTENSLGQVLRDDAQVVEVRLDSGELTATVAKGTGRVWLYRAGPWTVRVVGTVLTVSWQPSGETFRVSVQEGAVEVTGPGTPAPIIVRAGASLVRAPKRGEDLAVDHDVEVEMDVPAVVVRPTPRRATRTLAASDGGPPLPGWKTLLEAGLTHDGLDAARREGVLERIASLPDDEALLIADAARIEGSDALTNDVLHLVMERRGENAAEAAFLLGRIALDSKRTADAERLFERAIVLEQEDTFAEQARGRLLELSVQRKDSAEIHQRATEYLRHHPNGPWAVLARRLQSDAGR